MCPSWSRAGMRNCHYWDVACRSWQEVRVAGESRSGWLAGLAPGAVLAGYRLEARIGAGGMAVVFRAVDERLGRTVALKVLAPGLAGDGEFRERFVRESRAAATVDHPHIIPVYGAGEADGILFLAMRYVPGGDLRSVLHREGPLQPERAAFLLSPVASALDAAHGAGLVHRDVKPANILVDRSPGRPDHPYLSDFGLAKGAAGISSAAGLTGTGQFLGTADYAAPEQISGGRPHVQTDQYALACVAFTMLTGDLPFARDEPMAVLWAHLSAPPPSVTARRPDLSPAVDHVVGQGAGWRHRGEGETGDVHHPRPGAGRGRLVPHRRQPDHRRDERHGVRLGRGGASADLRDSRAARARFPAGRAELRRGHRGRAGQQRRGVRIPVGGAGHHRAAARRPGLPRVDRGGRADHGHRGPGPDWRRPVGGG